MTFLDTSVLVEHLSGNEKIAEGLENGSFKASTVSFFELFRGALRSEYEQHNMSVVQNRLDWIERADFGEEAARNAAVIEKELEEKGDMISLADILIAATCMSEGEKMLTTDQDFEKIEELEAEVIE